MFTPSVIATVAGDTPVGAGFDRSSVTSVRPDELHGFGSELSDGKLGAGKGDHGTVGQGTYSTVGGGYGDVHVTPRRERRETQVRLEAPEVECDGCDATIYVRPFKRCGRSVQYCYEKALLAGADAKAAKLVVELVIGPDGVIESAIVSGAEGEMRSCVVDHYRAMKLRASDEEVKVTIRIKIRPPM